MSALTIQRPDDWHVHLRDGAALASVVRIHRRALRPRHRHAQSQAAGRHYGARDGLSERILAALPAGSRFAPLMTLYLTDTTAARGDRPRAAAGFVHGVKLYPAGATTHSDAGVTDIRKTYAVLERMEELGMPLLVHGETPGADVDVFDRETCLHRRAARARCSSASRI